MMRSMRTLVETVAGFFLLSSLHFLPLISNAQDTITLTQSMKDGDSIFSTGGRFEMGFFSPGISKNRFLGIWFKNIPTRTVVWVANREAPLSSKLGTLKVINPGIMVLLNDANTTLWSSNASRTSQNPIVQLLDTGNVVVRDANDDNPENFLWQSFDYPSDTLLPGMKLGTNLVTGLERYLSSWTNEDDPSPGDFTYHCDPNGYPQNIAKKGLVELYRTGIWNGIGFSGIPNLHNNTIYARSLVLNDKEVYYSYETLNRSIVTRFTLNQSGVGQRWIWVDHKGWVIYLNVPSDNCDTYSLCGSYGSCDISDFQGCGCLKNFVPKFQNEWNRADWSNGCVRRTPLDCKSDGFFRYSSVKLPDSRNSWFNRSMSLEECRKVCLKNCSCMAYSNIDIRGEGSGCLVWYGDLIDIREFARGGQTLFVRMASSDLVLLSGSDKKKGGIMKVFLPLMGGILLICLSFLLFVWRKKHLKAKREGQLLEPRLHKNGTDERKVEDMELPLFDLPIIVNATSNFSLNNKLGEGGFGTVYKGILEEGQQIAVKRLSTTSIQGLGEFKNEVICISRLQHRNLVKLLGCCIESDEMMLIYEYMPNKSLDYFIFDKNQSMLLDWRKRFHIINGIARGLLYLHQDSRLRIIHRDLKASNILLDFYMNPKISDFGIARSFGENETEANTNKVVGTYGYMSPEYAADGTFSAKSDVFSFGVLVLEIVSGKKNRGFFYRQQEHNLLGHAWRLHREGRCVEMIDAGLGDSYCTSEVLRCIQVGLLCVQQYQEDRPSMSSVVVMLSNGGDLAQPEQPGFYNDRTAIPDRRQFEAAVFSSITSPTSINEVSITQLEGR